MNDKSKPIEIDLRRDLPKVRENWDALMKALPQRRCMYRAPCVIGAMMPAATRSKVQGTIGDLIDDGSVAVAFGQRRDMTILQKVFDNGNEQNFARSLRRIEAKYLPETSNA